MSRFRGLVLCTSGAVLLTGVLVVILGETLGAEDWLAVRHRTSDWRSMGTAVRVLIVTTIFTAVHLTKGSPTARSRVLGRLQCGGRRTRYRLMLGYLASESLLGFGLIDWLFGRRAA